MEKCISFNSPVGWLSVFENCGKINRIEFSKSEYCNKSELLKEAERQLLLYFEGKLKVFDLPLEIGGTEFQKKVYMELLKIPYGKTVSYKYIAEAIGNEKASRAVGGANNKNKIPIIIPCHRVIGSDGKLVGYADGISIKEALLDIEKNYS